MADQYASKRQRIDDDHSSAGVGSTSRAVARKRYESSDEDDSPSASAPSGGRSRTQQPQLQTAALQSHTGLTSRISSAGLATNLDTTRSDSSAPQQTSVANVLAPPGQQGTVAGATAARRRRRWDEDAEGEEGTVPSGHGMSSAAALGSSGGAGSAHPSAPAVSAGQASASSDVVMTHAPATAVASAAANSAAGHAADGRGSGHGPSLHDPAVAPTQAVMPGSGLGRPAAAQESGAGAAATVGGASSTAAVASAPATTSAEAAAALASISATLAKSPHPLIRGCRSVALYKPIHAIDEGAYGKVWLAEERSTGRRVALKQIKFDKINPNEGFPVTALREINTLLSLRHPNIVRVDEVVVGPTLDKVYVVMEFLPHNLRDFFERLPSGSYFTQAEVKCLMGQLLSGLSHMHAKWLLHRDLKTANILMDNEGRLVICDFGLARRYGAPLRQYTDTVVTLWYRSPEVLLGSRAYGPALDVWSVGCIMAELLTKEPLFTPQTEAAAIQAIFKLLGTPRDDSGTAGTAGAPLVHPATGGQQPLWPGWKQLPLVQSLRAAERNYPPQPLRRALKLQAGAYQGSANISDSGLQLLSAMLTLDPEQRITAAEALQHPWFTEPPLPLDPRLMPAFPSAHDGAGSGAGSRTGGGSGTGGHGHGPAGPGASLAVAAARSHPQQQQQGRARTPEQARPHAGGGAGLSDD